MAQAQVVITAVDKTKSAIVQAERGLKGIEKTAKITGKAINLSFGLITGGLLVSAFGKIAEAAKKTEEGQKAMAELARTLKDPALVSATNAITQGLIGGFNIALQAAVKTFKFIRGQLIQIGAINPNGSVQDVQTVLEGQLRQAQRGSSLLLPGEAAGELSSVEMANAMAAREAAKARIPLLQKQLELVRALADEEIKALNARIDAEIKAEQKPEKSTGSGRAPKKEESLQSYIASLRESQNAMRAEALAEWQKDLLSETDKILKKSADNAADQVLESVAESYKNNFVEQFTELTDFAREAAQGMQSVFANFLFDPFKEGLKGMLRGFVDIIRRMIAELLARQLLIAFFSAFAGGTGPIAAMASAAVSGLQGRAKGGPVTGSTPYMVGERGPELFVPSTSGTIIPNGSGMGGGVNIAYNIDARGASADMQKALPSILKENNRRIFEELDRRYGIGR